MFSNLVTELKMVHIGTTYSTAQTINVIFLIESDVSDDDEPEPHFANFKGTLMDKDNNLVKIRFKLIIQAKTP